MTNQMQLAEPTALAIPPEMAIEILREDGSPEARKILHRVAMQALRLAEAKLYSDAGLIPAHLRGKNAAIAVVCEIADQSGIDRFFALNNCYIVHDKVGFEAKFYIGMLSKSGRVKGPVKYDFIEDKDPEKLGVTASVVDAQSGETISHTLLWKTIVKSGWSGKNTWASDPRLMMKYRAAIQLIRTTYPEVMMGTYTKEEIQEMEEDGTFQRDSRPDTTYFPTGGSITDAIPTKKTEEKKTRKPRAKKEETPPPPLEEVKDLGDPANVEPFASFDDLKKHVKKELNNCINELQVQVVWDTYNKFCKTEEEADTIWEMVEEAGKKLS